MKIKTKSVAPVQIYPSNIEWVEYIRGERRLFAHLVVVFKDDRLTIIIIIIPARHSYHFSTHIMLSGM